MPFNYDSEWEEQAAAPSNPSSGNWKIYPKSDGFYAIDDAGVEYGPFDLGDMTKAVYDADDDGDVDPSAGGTGIDTSASTGHPSIDGGTWSIKLDNLSAGTAPTANDDSGSGYSVGSLWYDTTNDRLYVCMDASAASAVWIELTVPKGQMLLSAAGMWPSTTNGCADAAKTEYGTNDIDVYVLAFDPDSEEYAQVTTVMPDDYDGGTITARFIWTTTGSANDVIFGLQGIAYANDDAIDTAWGTAQEVTDTVLAANDEHVTSDTPAITLAGSPAGGQRVQFRVYRKAADGGDTLTADALLIGVLVEYNRSTS